MSEKVIFYARVSTNSAEQLESLIHQGQTLTDFMKKKNYSNSVLIKEIKSISNGMSQTLKNTLEQEPHKVNIVVMNFDRLIRDFADIKFLRFSVKNIISINEKKNINMESQWKELVPYIINSVEEIDKLKLRLKQYAGVNKRKRTPEEQVFTSKKRSLVLAGIISKDKYNDIIDDISKMIQKSQDLKCKNDWKHIANIAEEHGEKSILKDYKNAIQRQSDGEEVRFTIMKKDIYGYVKKIFNYLHIKVDDDLLNNFVNANITLGKKIVMYGDFDGFNNMLDIKEQEKFDEHLDDIVDILKKISVTNLNGVLTENEINKIKNITESIKFKNNVVVANNEETSNETIPKKKKKTT